MQSFQKDIFRDRLKSLRKNKKLTQAEAAELFDVSRTCYSSWELGQSCPPLDDLFTLCTFFDVSADFLIGRSDNLHAHKSIPVSIPNTFTARDPFDDLTPEQRSAIELSLKAFREANAAKAQEA